MIRRFLTHDYTLIGAICVGAVLLCFAFAIPLLYWHTSGNAVQDRELMEFLEIGAPGDSGSKDFVFRLPYGPCSFRGKAVNLTWTLELKAEGCGTAPLLKDIELSHLRRTL